MSIMKSHHHIITFLWPNEKVAQDYAYLWCRSRLPTTIVGWAQGRGNSLVGRSEQFARAVYECRDKQAVQITGAV